MPRMGVSGAHDILDAVHTDVAQADTPADQEVLTWEEATSRWLAQAAPGAGGGEANTASNVNTAGVGVFDAKVGVDLQFRGIIADSNKITVVFDDPNNEIGIDVAEANLTLSNLGGSVTDEQIPASIARDSELHLAVTVSGTPDYITLSGQDLVRGLIVLTTDVSGILPEANLPNASEGAEGVVELATQAEVDTGTDANRAITPDTMAGSDLSIKYWSVPLFDHTEDMATGDGKAYFHIPPGLAGMNLVYVHGENITAGTTGVNTVQVHNVTQAVNMLSTALTIDSTETGSDTAAAAAVIDAANDDVAVNDVIRADVDGIQTTPAKGYILTLGFQLP